MRRVILAVAFGWLVIFATNATHSQGTLNGRVQQIEERARQAESDAHLKTLALETRLTKLEVQLDTVVTLLKGAAGAVGLHLVSSFAGLVLRRKRGNDGD